MRRRLKYLAAAIFCYASFGVRAVFATPSAFEETATDPHSSDAVAETVTHADGLTEAAHAGDLAEAAHAGGSPGLPQLDTSTFPSQVFWLAVTFGILYIYFSKKTLPEISSVLENRREHIQGDLDTAERIRSEAECTQDAYEKLMNDARAESTRLLTEAETGVRTKMEKELSTLRDKAAGDMASLEERLRLEKQKAMKDMNGIAADIASRAAEKIVGIKPDLEQAQTVVQSLNRREAA